MKLVFSQNDIQFETLFLDVADNLKTYLCLEYTNKFHKKAYDVDKFKLQLTDPITYFNI